MFNKKENIPEVVSKLDDVRRYLSYFIQQAQWSALFIRNPGLLVIDVESESRYDDEGGYDTYTSINSLKFDSIENLVKFAEENRFDLVLEEGGNPLSLEELHKQIDELLNDFSLVDFGIHINPEKDRIFKRDAYLGTTITREENDLIDRFKNTDCTLAFEFLLRLMPKVMGTQEFMHLLKETYDNQ
jgi:hypothetical protein